MARKDKAKVQVDERDPASRQLFQHGSEPIPYRWEAPDDSRVQVPASAIARKLGISPESVVERASAAGFVLTTDWEDRLCVYQAQARQLVQRYSDEVAADTLERLDYEAFVEESRENIAAEAARLVDARFGKPGERARLERMSKPDRYQERQAAINEIARKLGGWPPPSRKQWVRAKCPPAPTFRERNGDTSASKVRTIDVESAQNETPAANGGLKVNRDHGGSQREPNIQ